MNLEEKLNSRNNNKTNEASIQYPFIKMKPLSMNKSTYFAGKIKSVDKIINTKLDQLLLTGFEGSEEDFNNIYGRHQPKKKIKIKPKRLNLSSIINPDYLSKSIKLTKIQEFNHTVKVRYKSLRKVLKELEKKKKEGEYKHDEKIYKDKDKSLILYGPKNASNLTIDNYQNRNHMIINKNNSKEKEKYNEEQKKRMENIRYLLKQKSDSILSSINNSIHRTNKKISNLNEEDNKNNLNKTELPKNYRITSGKNKDKKTIHKVTKVFKKYLKIKGDEQTNLKKVLDPLQNNFKSNLKEVQKFIGNNRENIWMKKSTANLISFGTSFMMISDDIFLREHKRIINKYPELEKEAQLSVPFYKVKKNKTIEKMEKNEKKIKSICSENDILIRGINTKYREQKMFRIKSQIFKKPKKKN